MSFMPTAPNCLQQEEEWPVYLFRHRGKAFGGVLRPHVKDVELPLQWGGHQFVHVDVFPVKLHGANLLQDAGNERQTSWIDSLTTRESQSASLQSRGITQCTFHISADQPVLEIITPTYFILLLLEVITSNFKFILYVIFL